MKTYSAGELTRQKIINAAGELAGERGIDNVSTRAVAERAGENIGSIHYHFGGKDGLFEAVLREAKQNCQNKIYHERISGLSESDPPEVYSETVRLIIRTEVNDLFRSNRPDWHSQLIYQVMQRDDRLYEIMAAEMMDPNMDALRCFFRLLSPELDEEELTIHIMVMLMPIFSHSTYMKALHRSIGVSAYSETYLQKLEDVLVRQTRLLLGLPEVD